LHNVLFEELLTSHKDANVCSKPHWTLCWHGNQHKCSPSVLKNGG